MPRSPSSASSRHAGKKQPTRSRTTSTCSSAFTTSPSRLGAPEDLEPDRVDLLHGARKNEGDEGTGITKCRPRHGLQAHRSGTGPLAIGERRTSRRPRARRSHVQEGGVGRARIAGSGSRRVINRTGRSTGFDYCSAPVRSSERSTRVPKVPVGDRGFGGIRDDGRPDGCLRS